MCHIVPYDWCSPFYQYCIATYGGISDTSLYLHLDASGYNLHVLDTVPLLMIDVESGLLKVESHMGRL